ncbi:MAG: RtcB family protein [Alphaproteobacteria bacterium]|nr:RtcB family protein [Alphaproteobacteria bacterium]
MCTLPVHARILARDDVRVEGDAVDQLARVAGFPGCVRAVGLPDLHPGPGIPIGAAFAFRDAVWPGLVGGDAGCGARLVALSKTRMRGDALERRVREWTEGPPLPDADPDALLAAVWARGPRGLAEVPGVPASLAALAEVEAPEPDGPVAPLPFEGRFGASLGTVGGGNHFAEISEVTEVADKPRARALGLRHGGTVVLVHSGSRGLGKALADRWGLRALTGADQAQYLGELAGALRFARANRLVIAWRLLGALGSARPSRVAHQVDLIHNSVVRGTLGGQGVWVHRKGSAPAEAGQPTVVLGSRGTPSWVMEGTGSEDSLASVAHGAGRAMGRSEAVAKLKPAMTRKSLLRTASGGRVICDDPELLYAEHPKAYKPIGPVVDSLVEAGLARPVAALLPQFTVKR